MTTRIALIVVIWAFASLCQPVHAAVTLIFLSRDLGVDFPHAFVETTGATNAAPQTVIHANYGFTAKLVSPSILLGPVGGEIMSVSDNYVRGSDRHFSVNLTDEQYSEFLALVDQWRSLPGRSYDLRNRNCVHFVKAVAIFVGLKAEHTENLMLKPRSFLDEVALENSGQIEIVNTYKPKLRPSNAAANGRPSHQQNQ